MFPPILVHLQFMQRKTIFYSVSIPDKESSKQIQWKHQIELYFLYYDPKHAVEIWKELYEELFGGGIVCWVWFFLITKTKQKNPLIWVNT